jgi:hypothetical protein
MILILKSILTFVCIQFYFQFHDLKTPVFANGTGIPNGYYRYLLRALRVTGNPQRQEDYESWLSPILGFWSSA